MTAVKAERASELACEATIIAAAKTFGWLVHGARPARTGKGWATPIKGHAGWPDLVLVRGAELLIVELKRKPNKVEPAQRIWIDALVSAGVEALVVFVPEQLDEFVARLAQRPKAAVA